ncbi:MAG: hypothetical protein WDW36_007074 [Sanguina aurantia]
MTAMDDLTPRYAEMVYNGFWFSPEREALQVLVDKTQEYCTGERRPTPGVLAHHSVRLALLRDTRGSLLQGLLVGAEPADSSWTSHHDDHHHPHTHTLLQRVPLPPSPPPSRDVCLSPPSPLSQRVPPSPPPRDVCPPPPPLPTTPRARARARAAGVVRLKLYKGNVMVQGRKSPYSLYDPVVASFEDDKGLYNQADAGGFIKLQALRLRTLAVNRHKML